MEGRGKEKRQGKRQCRSCGEKKEKGCNGMEISQEGFLLTVLVIDRSLEIEYFMKKRSRKNKRTSLEIQTLSLHLHTKLYLVCHY